MAPIVDCCAVRLDKRTYVLAGITVAAAVTLGYWAGAWAGVLAAFAGLIPAIFWEAAKDQREKARAKAELLAAAAGGLAPPQIMEGGVVRYLRPEAAIVSFWPRPELAVLREWLVSDRPAGI